MVAGKPIDDVLRVADVREGERGRAAGDAPRHRLDLGGSSGLSAWLGGLCGCAASPGLAGVSKPYAHSGSRSNGIGVTLRPASGATGTPAAAGARAATSTDEGFEALRES